VGYEVQIATNNTFTLGLQTANIPAGTTTNTFPTLADSLYFWRVRARYGDAAAPGLGPFSLLRGFTVDTVAPAAPVLTAPAANALVAAPKPMFTWVAVPGATSYLVDVDNTDTTFTHKVINGAPVVAATYTSTVVLPQGTYYWQVRAKDAAGNITASASRSFTIFIGLTPANGAVVPTGKPTFTWSIVPGATYNVQVATDTGFSAMVSGYPHPVGAVAAPAVPTYIPVAALLPGTYYWRVVSSLDVTASATVPYRTLFVGALPSVTPLLVSPNPGTSQNTLTVNLVWSAVTAPTGITLRGYEVQIAPNATFTGVGLQTFPVSNSTTNKITPALTTGVTYWWRVRGLFGDPTTPAPGPFSAVRTFIVDVVPPAAPVLVAPADKASVTLPVVAPAPAFKFTWNTVPGAVRYDFRYGTSTAMDITVSVAQLTTPGFVPSFTPPSPLLNETYYWQVVAYDAGGNASAPSVMRSVKILSAANAVPVLNRFTGAPITLSWGPISWVSPSGHYELLVANNVNFVNPKYTNLTITAGIQSIDVSPLPEGTWYWKVRGCTGLTGAPGTTCGNYSTTGTFTVNP
jgi:hypothetical protein